MSASDELIVAIFGVALCAIQKEGVRMESLFSHIRFPVQHTPHALAPIESLFGRIRFSLSRIRFSLRTVHNSLAPIEFFLSIALEPSNRGRSESSAIASLQQVFAKLKEMLQGELSWLLN